MRRTTRLAVAALAMTVLFVALPAAAGAKTTKVNGTATVTVTATITHVGAKRATGTATFSGTTDTGSPVSGHGRIKLRGTRASDGTFHSTDAKTTFTGQIGSATKLRAHGTIHWTESVVFAAAGSRTGSGTLTYTGTSNDGQSI